MKDVESYPLVIRYMPEAILKKLQIDSPRTEDDIEKFVEELKAKLRGENMSKDIEFETDFLKSYARSCDYEVNKASSKIQNLLTLRINHNYFFHNLNYDFTQIPSSKCITIMPHRQKDGSVTVIFRLGKWNPDELPFEQLKQIIFIIYVQELRNPVTQASGLNIINDFADSGLRFFKYITPLNVYLLNHVAFDIIPAVFLGIHVVNINFLGNLLLTLSRPFLPSHIQNILYVHSSVEDLHKFFPLSTLPADYGGTLVDFYPDEWLRKANEQHGDFPEGGQKNIF